MKNQILKLVALFALTLATVGAQAAPHREVIMGVTYDRTGVTYQVKSGGCTGKEHFEIQIQESYPLGLVLMRVTDRMCEAYVPYGTKIHYSWEELQIPPHTRFNFANPIAEGVYVPIAKSSNL